MPALPRHGAGLGPLGNLPFALGVMLLLLLIGAALAGPDFARYDPAYIVPTQLGRPPSGQHLMGTSLRGQDIYAQWVTGARYSLSVTLLAGLVSTVVAVAIGVGITFRGGALDRWATVGSNLFLVVPPIPFLLILGLGGPMPANWQVVLPLVLVTWSYGARLLRGPAQTMRRRDFVEAAISAGESLPRLVLFDLLPNLWPLIALVFVNLSILALQGELVLEFVGLVAHNGITPDGWGEMLANALGGAGDAAVPGGLWWEWLFPSLGIALTGAALTFLGLGLDTLADPRLRLR